MRQAFLCTNGNHSCYFKITRSIRHGCPIAAFLYIISAVPAAKFIRKSVTFQCKNFCRLTKKLSHSCLQTVELQNCLKNIESSAECLKLFTIYEKDDRINKQKTKLNPGTNKNQKYNRN